MSVTYSAYIISSYIIGKFWGYIIVRNKPLLCLTWRGRGNMAGFANAGRAPSERYQQRANQRLHMQMLKWRYMKR